MKPFTNKCSFSVNKHFPVSFQYVNCHYLDPSSDALFLFCIVSQPLHKATSGLIPANSLGDISARLNIKQNLIQYKNKCMGGTSTIMESWNYNKYKWSEMVALNFAEECRQVIKWKTVPVNDSSCLNGIVCSRKHYAGIICIFRHFFFQSLALMLLHSCGQTCHGLQRIVGITGSPALEDSFTSQEDTATLTLRHST